MVESSGYILAIDQGTTSSRVLVFDHELKIVDSESIEHEQISLQPGWVEHDPEVIYQNVILCINKICLRQNLTSENVKAVGITNQRETTVAFDKKTGKAFCNAIVWCDKRTAEVVKDITLNQWGGDIDLYRSICGLPINTYFSAVKMRWMLENIEEVKAESQKEDSQLCFGTIDTWLIARLTGLTSIVTDSTNASRTMLMNLDSLEWDQKMLQAFQISEKWLPKIIKSNCADFGKITSIQTLKGVQIGGAIGDQQAACLGHILKPGQVKTTYGTGCFILTNVGLKPKQSLNGLLSTVCYTIGEETFYAIEGAVEVAGAAIQWAKSVGLIAKNENIEAEALEVEDCGDVYFVPAFQGIFSPYWKDDARGLLIGMNTNTKRGHLMRAFIEAPCLRTAQVVGSMEQDLGASVNKMSVDGGMTVNNLLLQTQADLINAVIERKAEKEITSVGAAIAAGLAVKFWESLSEVESRIKVEAVFTPQISNDLRNKKLKRFGMAVERSIGFGWE